MTAKMAERPPSQFREITPARCHELLAAHNVGRVAWNSPDGPQILPVTYALHAGDIVFRTTPYGVLSQLEQPTNVAFEVDQIDEATKSGWSVMVRGRASAVAGHAKLADLWTGPGVVPWAPGIRNVFIAIAPRVVGGRIITSLSSKRETCSGFAGGPSTTSGLRSLDLPGP